MDINFRNIECRNSTSGTLLDRVDRAYWLNCGIEMLSEIIASSNGEESYSNDEIALMIRAFSWELGAELGAITGAIN